MPGRRILVTGAAGAVGHAVCAGLTERGHFVRGFDRRPAHFRGEHRVADLRDFSALREAATEMDTVIHLAAVPDRDNFADELVPNNVVGTQRVLEAARLCGVRRVIYGSSCRVVGGLDWQQDKISLAAGLVPGDHYGVSKATGELLARMYADRFGISIICARLGWFVRNPEEAARVESVTSGTRIYLSHRDALEFFSRAVVVEDVPYAAVFVGSHNGGRCLFDLEPTRALLGYEPRDTWPEGSSWSSDMPFASPRRGASLLPE
jgi:nucleoside-diphosphate-sugar epimerase